jgi:hypothetical protein
VGEGEYTLDDLFMLLKALAIFEASISPVGRLGKHQSFYSAACLGLQSYSCSNTIFFSFVSTWLSLPFAYKAGFLPVKLLVDLLNFSLANDVAGRVSSALAMELDRRLKKSILGDENYVLGDATKKTIVRTVRAFTGKGVCA